jgi:RNase H-fold protein (predicted Holliday junction resolvase)
VSAREAAEDRARAGAGGRVAAVDLGAKRIGVDEAAALRALLEPAGVSVETADERFTTVEAERALRTAGRTGKAARKVVDSAAAMVLLQAWLDNG